MTYTIQPKTLHANHAIIAVLIAHLEILPIAQFVIKHKKTIGLLFLLLRFQILVPALMGIMMIVLIIYFVLNVI